MEARGRTAGRTVSKLRHARRKMHELHEMNAKEESEARKQNTARTNKIKHFGGRMISSYRIPGTRKERKTPHNEIMTLTRLRITTSTCPYVLIEVQIVRNFIFFYRKYAAFCVATLLFVLFESSQVSYTGKGRLLAAIRLFRAATFRRRSRRDCCGV